MPADARSTWSDLIALLPSGTGAIGADDIRAIVKTVQPFSAARAPAVTDDTGSGFDIGQLFEDSTGPDLYVCLDATPGAALWLKIGSGSWADITGKPSTFPPSAHAASHAAAGSDPVTPAAIGAATAAQGALADSAVQPGDDVSTLGSGAAAAGDVPKADGAGNVAWGPESGGGASSPLTTKGDLWGFDTGDARLPVGTDGQVLTADSAAALGLSFQTPAAGGGSNPVMLEQALTAAAGSVILDLTGFDGDSFDFVMKLRSTATTSDYIDFAVDGDTTSGNYNRTWLNNVSYSTTDFPNIAQIATANDAAGNFVLVRGSVVGLRSGSRVTVFAQSGNVANGGENIRTVFLTYTASTAKPSQITFTPEVGSLDVGSYILVTDPRKGGGSTLLPLTVNAQTGTAYTLALTDAEGMVTLDNASAITLTVPPNSSVAFPVGTVVAVAQLGAGAVTVSPGSGVTITSLASATNLSGQGAKGKLVQIAADTWLLSGDLA